MFGFYDPASLKIEGALAAIDFIEATAGEVVRIDISSAEEARRVAVGLRDQGQHGIASRFGALRTVRGSLVLIPQAPDQGLMMIEGEKKSLPVKMAFDVSPETLPSNSFAMAQGVDHDGAFLIHKVALKAFGPLTEPRPAPKDEQRLN